MSFDHLLSLVNHVPLAALDALSRDLWRAAGEGALTEAQAQALAEAIHGRRRPRAQASAVSLGGLAVFSSRKPPEAAAEAPEVSSGQSPGQDPRSRTASTIGLGHHWASRTTSPWRFFFSAIQDAASSSRSRRMASGTGPMRGAALRTMPSSPGSSTRTTRQRPSARA